MPAWNFSEQRPSFIDHISTLLLAALSFYPDIAKHSLDIEIAKDIVISVCITNSFYMAVFSVIGITASFALTKVPVFLTVLVQYDSVRG
jgi:hypothetical protein